MKQLIKILACTSLIFNTQFPFPNLMAQELPQGYFRNPLGRDISLSATFAEFRTGHFHSGLDMRTGGAVDLPVYAAAEGYVARVSISPWGGGKILYIKHPNGYISVYMHLNGFAGAIGKAVLKEQYEKRSFIISKIFAPSEIPVKKGQLVAYSGNTGGSGGPHLHFEIRRGGEADMYTHSTTFNPLHMGLPYTDNIKPVIRGLRIYPEGSDPFEVAKDNTISVNGPFYLGIYATDAAEGSTAKNGTESIEVYLDGTLFFRYTTKAVPIDSSRMVNALLDYPLFARTRQAYLLTRSLPGAKGPWIPVRMGDGIFRLKAGSTHRIGVKVYDVRGNSAERVVTVNVKSENEKKKKTSDGTAVKYNKPFDYQHSTFNFHLEPFTLYDDDYMAISGTGQTVCLMPTVNDIPPHLAYSLSIRGSLPGVPADKTVIVRVTRKPGNAKYTAYKTAHADGCHTAQVRDWGEFTLAADTEKPRIIPINFSEKKSLKSSTLKVKITDNLAGIETYNCYLNGQWILAEFDGKSATLAIDASGKIKGGANKLRVEVVDAAGNVADVTYIIRKT